MCTLEVHVAIQVVEKRSDKEARPLSLNGLTEEAVRAGATHVLVEREESLERADRRLIADVIRRAGSSAMQYRHVAPGEHPLLYATPSLGITRTAATGSVAQCDR